MGGLFSKTAILGSRFLERTGISIVVIVIVCGGIIAIVKSVSDSATTGIGNRQTQAILHGLLPWTLLIHALCSAYTPHLDEQNKTKS
jgi:Na+-translocating ferredoxin:NAD+ oxidoreductase RnfG subunit